MCVFCLMTPRPPPSTLFPYTTLFRSVSGVESLFVCGRAGGDCPDDERAGRDSSSDDLLAVSGERRAEVGFFGCGAASGRARGVEPKSGNVEAGGVVEFFVAAEGTAEKGFE